MNADLYVFGKSCVPEVHRINPAEPFLNANWKTYSSNCMDDESIPTVTPHYQKLKIYKFFKVMRYDSVLFMDADILPFVDNSFKPLSVFEECKLEKDTQLPKNCLYNHGKREGYISYMKAHFNSTMVYPKINEMDYLNLSFNVSNLEIITGETAACNFLYFNSGFVAANQKGVRYLYKHMRTIYESFFRMIKEKNIATPTDWDQTLYNFLWLGAHGPAYEDSKLEITLISPDLHGFQHHPAKGRIDEMIALYGVSNKHETFSHFLGIGAKKKFIEQFLQSHNTTKSHLEFRK
eukprot:Pgem_evm1s18855